MYSNNSPWRNTRVMFDKILDIQQPRFIYKDPLDMEYIIPQKFNLRRRPSQL